MLSSILDIFDVLSIYRVLLFVLSPFIKIYFYARCFYKKDRIESVKNHFGFATIERPKGELIWIHAASIGESTSALTYIKHLKKQFPELNVLLTTITVTSADMLIPKISKIKGCYHQFVVVDNSFWVRRFLNYWNPKASFFLESEIWPNTVDELYRRKIPIFLLNARLSPKSFAIWSRFRSVLAAILQKFTCILAQSKIDADRFRFFSPKNTKQIDNLKYANDPLPCDENLFDIFSEICKGKKVFVAASTHEKEEEIILEAHKLLKSKFNDIVTIIIPRHLTRIKRVCEIFQKHNVTFSLRSELKSVLKSVLKSASKLELKSEIFCVDTFGEIGTFFRLADVCFVGGSLVPIGGHNIYEPIALGKPVLHGPYMANALEVRDLLQKKQVAYEVKDPQEIYDICFDLLSDPQKLKKISKLAKELTHNESLEQIDNAVGPIFQ
jgi:3-deoxy-D-manno-octulosonic-acid transferase